MRSPRPLPPRLIFASETGLTRAVAGMLVGAMLVILAAPADAQEEPSIATVLQRMAASEPKPSPPLSIAPAPGATTASTALPTPVIPSRGRLVGSPQALNADQRALAAKVSTYLSSLQNVSGNFVQIGPDGSRTTGDFYIQKPGRVRFEYNPPAQVELIADGSSVVVRDRKLATQDVYPLSQTPLRYLLAERIDLVRDTNLVGVSADDSYITIVIEEKQAAIGTSRLMMMLSAKDTALKQWTVTDPQGYDTTVAVHNMTSAKKIDPSLFKIDYTRYNN